MHCHATAQRDRLTRSPTRSILALKDDRVPEPQPETTDALIRDHVMPDLARVLRLLEGEKGTEKSGLVKRMERAEDRLDQLDRFVDKFIRPLIYVLGVIIPIVLGYIVLQFIQQGP